MRIDDRLIHGQVIAVWCKHLQINRIAIVDDGVAADPFMQEVLTLAAPQGIRVEVYPVAQAIKVLGQDPVRARTTMILVKSPAVARQLYEGGLKYSSLNVGGIGSGPGRKNIFKNISASEQEIATLKSLMDQGVQITLLTVPGEKSKAFAEVVGR